MSTIDEYAAGLAPAGAAFVEELRRRVHAHRGDVTETIRYDIPTFQVDGRSRLHAAVWAKHVSIYPVPGAPELAEELAPYRAGKGTLRFPLDRPVPWATVDKIVAELLA